MKFSELGKEEEQRVLELHRKAVVINALDSTISMKGLGYSDQSFLKLREGGVTAVNFTLLHPWLAIRQIFERIYGFYELFKRSCDKALLATSVEDIRRAKENGKMAVTFGLQNASQIEDGLNLLAIFHRLGIKIIQLTYQRRNLIGDGCGERTDCGLSRFGIQVVEEMNKLGILIDLSHVGYTTTIEAIEISKEPVVFSHSNVRSLCDHVRNKSDEQIRALAEKGGVIDIASQAHFLKPYGPIAGATIEDYLDHIDYVVKLAGQTMWVLD
jgi:membrane dipeptidase